MARDPNQIRSEGWLSTAQEFKDASVKVPDGIPAGELGTKWYAYFRTYSNGRRTVEWYKRGSGGGAVGADGKPGDRIDRTTEETVPGIKSEWDKEEEKDAEQAGKKVKRKFRGTDPATGRPATVTEYEDGTFSYDEITPPAGVAADAVPNIEGTPLSGGGFDNSRPIKVWRRPDGTQVKVEDLSKDERERWEREKNGGKTDAQIQAESEESSSQDAVPNRPGWVKITRKKGNDTKTVYRGPDGKEVDTLPSEDGTSSVQFVHTDGKTYYTIKRKTGNNVEEYTASDPEGKNRVTLPGKESRSSVQKRAPNGTVYYEVTVEKDGRKDSYTSSDPEGANRIPPPDPNGVKPLPPGMPELDTSTPERARATYLAQVQWAQNQRRTGAMSSQEVQEILTPSHAAAQAVIDAEQRRLENERATRGQDITQEGNRLQAATSQYTNAQRATDDVWKVAPRGGSQASDVLMGTILLQQLMNQGIRGNVAPPVGKPDPLTTPAAAAATPGPTGVAAVDAAVAGATPPVDPQAASKAEAAAVRAARREAGIPPPAPVFRPMPVAGSVAPVSPASVTPGASPPAAPVRNPALVNTDPFDGATPVAAPPVQTVTPGPDPQKPEGEWVGGRVIQPPAATSVAPLAPAQPVEETLPAEQGPGLSYPGFPVEVQQPTNLDPNSEGTPTYNPAPGETGHRPFEPVGYRPLPAAVASAYGRSLIDSIMRQYGGAA